MRRLGYAGLVVCLIAVAALAGQKNDPKKKDSKADAKNATVTITVLKESNGKPVKNAEVVFHQVTKDGQTGQEGLELKTHEDGKAESGGIPYGKVRIQVIATGFRTHGEDYDINQPEMQITIKLQRPTDQFSIYK